MKKLICPIHNLDIIIYNKEEEIYFENDNKKEVAIFYNGDKKYLKRFVINLCDENCETIKQLLNE